ncbi:hypothetical protein QUV83_00900 [Cellulomonas cellasea]|uniref:hypothetical protein n=1 Tax=Cellulomonas cellasea TaxID=43670 RepID=UPI0025A42F77|nr:hypothetical protein [Cellulomonas cellasea]MDM8083322.1 hypothetical protein [Cellulomonas cellasea]
MSLWVPVVAALGASLLTTLGAWGLETQRRRAAARSQSVEVRRAAYVAFVEAAHGVLMLGQTLRALLQVQSGFAVSAAELLRIRRPLDPHEIAWRMSDQVRPVLDAQAGVIACGTPEAARATREVVTTASAYLQAATAMTGTQRRLSGVVPWRATAGQEAELAAHLDRAGQAVRVFTTIMRVDLGEDALSIEQVETRVSRIGRLPRPGRGTQR